MTQPPELARVFKGHTSTVTGTAFHPCMHQLISGSHDGNIFVWHFKQQLRPFKFVGHKGEINDISVGNDGSYFASASSDKTVNLWTNSSKGTPAATIKAHTAPVRSCHFSADNTLLVSGSDDKVVKVWKTTPSSAKFLTSFDQHSHWVRSVRFSQDDANLIVSCGDDKTVRIWDLRLTKDRACVMKMTDHSDRVNRAIFHPDGTCVASCSDDRTIKVWDLRRKRLIQHYDAHQGAVYDIDFSPKVDALDGKNFLASCSADKAVKLWDLQEGRLMFTMSGHEDAVRSVKFSPHGAFLCSGAADSKVFIWNSGLNSIGSSSGANANNAGAGGVKVEAHKEKLETQPQNGNVSGARAYLYAAPKGVGPASQGGENGGSGSGARFKENVYMKDTVQPLHQRGAGGGSAGGTGAAGSEAVLTSPPKGTGVGASALGNSKSNVGVNVGAKKPSTTAGTSSASDARPQKVAASASKQLLTGSGNSTSPMVARADKQGNANNTAAAEGKGQKGSGTTAITAKVTAAPAASAESSCATSAMNQTIMSSLNHMTSQLEMLMKTVSLLDKRMTATEATVQKISKTNGLDDFDSAVDSQYPVMSATAVAAGLAEGA